MYPSHDGAERTCTELSGELGAFAREVEELLAPIWEEEYHWARRWMEVMDHPPDRVRASKRAYRHRRERIRSSVHN